jgi:hypothetical protein
MNNKEGSHQIKMDDINNYVLQTNTRFVLVVGFTVSISLALYMTALMCKRVWNHLVRHNRRLTRRVVRRTVAEHVYAELLDAVKAALDPLLQHRSSLPIFETKRTDVPTLVLTTPWKKTATNLLNPFSGPSEPPPTATDQSFSADNAVSSKTAAGGRPLPRVPGPGIRGQGGSIWTTDTDPWEDSHSDRDRLVVMRAQPSPHA